METRKRLEFAKKMGAEVSVDFTQYKGIEALTEAVKEAQGGHLADFAFQCTGNPHAHATSTNSSVTAVAFASLVSSSMVEMLQSTRTSISAPKKSTWLVPGYTH